jgi:DNA repair exonuclease SbcCD ATPase subunit
MSVSDFANFIDLTPEEKRKIINKLFNLQDLDNYLSLCNNIIKQKTDEISKYETIIETNNETIKTLKQNIISIKRSGVIDRENEIKKLEESKNSKKEPFLKLKSNITDYDKKIIELEKQRQDFENRNKIKNDKLIELKIELKNINEKLKIYKSGKCPLCGTNLEDEKHKHDLTNITTSKKEKSEEYKKTNNENNDILLKLTQISNKKETLRKQKTNSKNKLNSLIFDLKGITKKIAELKNIDENTLTIEEIEKNINELKEKNNKNINKVKELEDYVNTYNELKNVFSTDGIRKSIINNIIKPINVNLKEILDDMNSTYNIKISENFNVKIFERLTNEIDTETLSMGESKKINIAIALSYLRLILKFRKLNILFLDEVFSSMEPDNVEYTLNVLKKLTKEFNLNIIILDPKVYFTDDTAIGYDYFDRVLKIDKKMSFTSIKELG